MSTAPPALTPQPSFARRYRRVLREGTWVVIGQAVSAVAGLAGTRLITQFVAPEIYGLANLLMAGEIFARNVFFGPVINAGIRQYPDAENAGMMRQLRALLARLITRNLLLILPVLVAGAFFYLSHQPLRTLIAFALGAYLVVDITRTFEMAMVSTARQQSRSAVASMIEAIARPLLILAGVKLLGASALTVIAGMTGAGFLALIILRLRRARDAGHLAAEHDGPADAELAASVRAFARPLIPVYLVIWITSLSDRYIIQWIVKDTSAVGIYAAGYGLISQPFVLAHTVLSMTLRPIHWAAVSQKNSAQARRTFIIWLLAAIGICGGGVLLSIVLRKPVVRLFLAPRYAQTVDFVPWIAAGYFFYVVQQTLEQNLLAHRRTSAVLIEEIFAAIVSIVATIPLVRAFGALGAAYACPIYFGAQCGLTGTFVAAQKRSKAKQH